MYTAVVSRLSGRLSGGRKIPNPISKFHLKQFSDNPQSLNKPQNPPNEAQNSNPIKPPTEPTFKNERFKTRPAYPKGTIIFKTTVLEKAKEGNFMKWLAITSGFATIGSIGWMYYDYKKSRERNLEQHRLTLLLGEEGLAYAKHNSESMVVIRAILHYINSMSVVTNLFILGLAEKVASKEVVAEIQEFDSEVLDILNEKLKLLIKRMDIDVEAAMAEVHARYGKVV